MYHKRSRIAGSIALSLMTLMTMAAVSFPAPPDQGDDPNPPDHVVKLVFIHHSTGENWLTDGYGDLGKTLGENNYFVSDTNYGWGPDAIGDRTDIPDWIEWFASESTSIYLNALFLESGQNASYTRNLPDPGGENEIIMFKSCFPNSALEGNPADAPAPEGWLSVGHAKYVYNQILRTFANHPEKLFVVITAPPLSDPTYAQNARAFNEWLFNDWLQENNYTQGNVVVFDFYNILTNPNAHHRFVNGKVEHSTTANNTLYYPSGDDHPSIQGSRKATEEFVPLLNVFYHRWKNALPAQGVPQSESAAQPTATDSQIGVPQTMTSSLIDDFEGGPIAGTAGWESYYQDNADTTLNCSADPGLAHKGASSLKFQFEVDANSWATCGFYFDTTQNWSEKQGISFYLRADMAGIPFDVDLYGGSPGGRTTYIHGLETTAESLNDWILIQIPWSEIRRVEWEDNPGTQFNPSEVTGFSVGLSAPETSRLNGVIWLDDLSLMGGDSEEFQPPVVDQPADTPRARNFLCGGAGAMPLAFSGMVYISRRRRMYHH